jgi:hypothetical protein
MDNEEPEAPAATEERPDLPVEIPAERPDEKSERPMTRTERRLRKLAGRKSPYEGPMVGIARGWVSRDGRMHLLAARYLDFAVLTTDHLVLCSTGFFTRRPRRRVFREALGRLEVTPLGGEPVRTVRVAGSFRRPIRLELRPNEAGLTFARELLACTRPTVSRGADTPGADS